MAEKKQSKTARQAVRAGGAAGSSAVQILGEIRYLVPLNGGRNAYVRNIATGRTPNVRTDSPAFVDEVRELVAAGHGHRLRAELDVLHKEHPTQGWDLIAKRLDGEGVFSA
jgi:hypothetical protein